MKNSLAEKFSKERVRLAIDYYRYLLPFSIRNQFRDNLSNDSIISIFASPRGGSTWLAQILGQIPESTLVWEPLFRHQAVRLGPINPFSYQHPKKLGIWWNQHIPEDESWPEVEEFFRKLFNREIVNLKLYRYTDLSKVPSSKVFIYKFCFGNLLMPWLIKRFNIKPILLVRHPCAVVASQLEFGAFQYMKDNPKINTPTWARYCEYYLPYEDVMKKIDTPEGSLAIRWALANKYPLSHPRNNIDWLTVSYESLITNTQFELNRIRDWIGIDFSNDEKKVKGASFTSHKEKVDPIKQISNWKRSLNPSQVEAIVNVVRSTGLDLYSEDAMPDLNVLYKKNG